MPQDALLLKEKIMQILNRKGPCIPVQIARETGLSILFASAFLSELYGDKRIKMSYLKVGSSPIYFLQDHLPQLERFSDHLKSKEKDAYLLLKERSFLKDSDLNPAIRVALREIKDFAVPFQKNNEVFWRYFIVPESEFSFDRVGHVETNLTEEKKVEAPKLEIKEETRHIEIEPEIQDENEEDKIEETEDNEIEEVDEQKHTKEIEEPKKKEKQKKVKKPAAKKVQKKGNETLFNKVKEYLASKNIEIVDIESFDNTELVLRIREGKKESLLIAYSKKKVAESDILKAYKKASEAGLPYTILTFGETSKKLSSFIDAIKGMSGMERVD